MLADSRLLAALTLSAMVLGRALSKLAFGARVRGRASRHVEISTLRTNPDSPAADVQLCSDLGLRHITLTVHVLEESTVCQGYSELLTEYCSINWRPCSASSGVTTMVFFSVSRVLLIQPVVIHSFVFRNNDSFVSCCRLRADPRPELDFSRRNPGRPQTGDGPGDMIGNSPRPAGGCSA